MLIFIRKKMFGIYTNSMKEGTMPLSSYTIMHTDAKLSEENKKLVTDWASKTKDSMEVKN